MSEITYQPMNQLSLLGNRPVTTKPTSVKGCTLIYTPKGRAREYASLACNVYRGCDHQCTYCYAPSATRRNRDDFAASSVRPGAFRARLETEARKYRDAGIQGQVLLSFTCDPYQRLDLRERVTRSAIQILHRHGLNVQILTKGGGRALRDLDLFGPRDAFATTLTLLDDIVSRTWEPYAATPSDRIETIRQFHQAGIPTWVSLEPVLDPSESLRIIRATHPFVDLFKIGKLNYLPLAQTIDWRQFARDAIDLLRSLGYQCNTDHDNLTSGQFYIKRDLARYL